MSTTEEKIAVMRAHIDGHTIEAFYSTAQKPWTEVNHPAWNWAAADYRIKREPRTWYVIRTSEGTRIAATPPDAAHSAGVVEVIEVREVMP